MKKLIKKFYILFDTTALSTFNIIVIIIAMILNVGCNTWKCHTPKYLHIEQGIYLTPQNMQKISIGMTKSSILENIGSPPILTDLFGLNKWHYVYCLYNTKGQLQY